MKLVLCSAGTGRACGENGVQVLTVSQYIDIPLSLEQPQGWAEVPSHIQHVILSHSNYMATLPECLEASQRSVSHLE